MTEQNGQWHVLAEASELAPGEMLAREVGAQNLALYNVDGTFYATDNVCTHAYALLTDGWLDRTIVECPLHGGQFDVCTGKAVYEPADEALKTYPVRVVDGRVEVQV